MIRKEIVLVSFRWKNETTTLERKFRLPNTTIPVFTAIILSTLRDRHHSSRNFFLFTHNDLESDTGNGVLQDFYFIHAQSRYSVVRHQLATFAIPQSRHFVSLFFFFNLSDHNVYIFSVDS